MYVDGNIDSSLAHFRSSPNGASGDGFLRPGRPLSDIHETTEPSFADVSYHMSGHDAEPVGLPTVAPEREQKSAKRANEAMEAKTPRSERGRRSPAPSVAGRSQAADSVYSIPNGYVPQRASSRLGRNRGASKQVDAIVPQILPQSIESTVPNRGKSRSPVRDAMSRLDAVTSDGVRHIPSKTFIRSNQALEILDDPVLRHHRVNTELKLAASLFVGGGSVEGDVLVMVDHNEKARPKKGLALCSISVDLIGVEEVSGQRRSIFLNLATELVDVDNPPPASMLDLEKHEGVNESCWHLIPCYSSLPFCLSLPLDVGSPPFHSRRARIRFVLCVTILIKESGRRHLYLYLVLSPHPMNIYRDEATALRLCASLLDCIDRYG